MLHEDKQSFEQVILRTSEYNGIDPAIIEKDYYVTLFLKLIVEKQPDIIFKGGTSLSKCYKLIDRFSEDIDLNIYSKTKPTEGQRKDLKKNVVSVIEQMKFTLTNAEDIKSRRDFNRYIVDYSSIFGAGYLKQHLVVETAVYLRAYPSERMTASCMVYDFLKSKGLEDIIKKYELLPFELNVQAAERTLIDKIYALGDYYLSNNINEHSRHIYDLYKLLTKVALNDDLSALAKEVARERRNHKACLSAQDGVNINALLQEIIDKEIYKSDYENVTLSLLFEKVDYNTAISALRKVIDSKILN